MTTLVRKRRNLMKTLHQPKPPPSPSAPISNSFSPSLSTHAAAEVAISIKGISMTSYVNICQKGGGVKGSVTVWPEAIEGILSGGIAG